VAIAMLLFAVPSAFAAPANDNFVARQTIPSSLPQAVTGTTENATVETGEPHHFGGGFPAQSSVWFEWTAPSNVRVKLETCDPDGAPGIAVYTGTSVGGLTAVANSGGGCRTHFDAQSGHVYEVAVDQISSPPSGTWGPFQLLLRQLVPPANDNLAAAQAIPASLPQSLSGTTLDATHETGEPAHGGFSGPTNTPSVSAWYSWTSGVATSQVSVNVCPDGGTLAVYTGNAYSDPLVAAAPNNGSCQQRFTAAPSTTYKIAVDSYSEGPFTLALHVMAPPANDNLAAAQLLAAGLPQAASGTNVDATAEIGEPQHTPFEPATASVWYRWSSGPAGVVVIDACRSPDDHATGVALYSGDAYPVTRVTSLDPFYRGCHLRFAVAASTEYKIAVDGPEGSFPLTLRALSPPANDALTNAQVLTGAALPLAVSGTVLDATAQPGEPAHAGPPAHESVWYQWRPAASGQATIDTCNSSFYSRFAVYTGPAVPAPADLVAEPSAAGACAAGELGSRATISADSSKTYWVAVDSFSGEGAFTLAISGPNPPGVGGAGAGVVPGLTGRRAAALKKCKKAKIPAARKRCKKKANKLPV
jgi:hypothetical protein